MFFVERAAISTNTFCFAKIKYGPPSIHTHTHTRTNTLKTNPNILSKPLILVCFYCHCWSIDFASSLSCCTHTSPSPYSTQRITLNKRSLPIPIQLSPDQTYIKSIILLVICFFLFLLLLCYAFLL